MTSRSAFVTSLLLTLIVVAGGCGTPQEQKAANEPAATPAPAAPAATSSSAKLGEEVEADHFMVTLATDPAEPKAGKVKLIAKVSHHGEPAAAATINVTSEMPKMGHAGPSGVLKHTKDGVFEGELDLPMAGEFTIKLDIEQDGHTGAATFGFIAK